MTATMQPQPMNLPPWQDYEDDNDRDEEETYYLGQGEDWFSSTSAVAAASATDDFATGVSVQLLWDMAAVHSNNNLPQQHSHVVIPDDDADMDDATAVTATDCLDSKASTPAAMALKKDEWTTDEDMTDSEEEWEEDDDMDGKPSPVVTSSGIFRCSNSNSSFWQHRTRVAAVP
uniref:Uncharacterized protein n=1 Tax=Amphora coffeiformis TaxID=265554 RepID=A0A7S3P717_9STRA|mmetsp:Transcript_12045/g.23138  ORF Transcript_12045/g.23138 Transcript_12045/m.23138 type:complete len:174 (+) Transcript_12045:88-609(+)|eukprot:scaffold12318_cov151-Amphora_coffeaeformis.AAC.8